MKGYAFHKDAAAFVDSERKSRIPNDPPSASHEGKYKDLPASSNIEDRRGEVGTHALLQSWTGLTPSDWGTAIRHPTTPFWDLFPRQGGGENKNSSLATEAGLNNIRKDNGDLK